MDKKVIEIPESCSQCRFEVLVGLTNGKKDDWCAIYDNHLDLKPALKKPDFCKATSVTIEVTEGE
jgi:hypothetical protein